MVCDTERDGDGTFGADLAGCDVVFAVAEDEALGDGDQLLVPVLHFTMTYCNDVGEAKREADDARTND